MAEGQIGNTVMVLCMTFKSYEAIYGTFNHQAFQIYTPRHLTPWYISPAALLQMKIDGIPGDVDTSLPHGSWFFPATATTCGRAHQKERVLIQNSTFTWKGFLL